VVAGDEDGPHPLAGAAAGGRHLGLDELPKIGVFRPEPAVAHEGDAVAPERVPQQGEGALDHAHGRVLHADVEDEVGDAAA
jgi:hypothetical protein